MRCGCVIALVGHVCRRVVEAGRFRNGAGAGVTRTCLDTPPERSVLASQREDGVSGKAGSSAFHVKLASELSVPRANGKDLQFLHSRRGVLRTHGAATLVHLLRARRMGNNDAHRVTGMDSLGIYGRQPIGRWSIHTQCSTFMFHVKPGVDRTHWPIQRVSAAFTGHAPFSHSPSRRMRLSDPGRSGSTVTPLTWAAFR